MLNAVKKLGYAVQLWRNMGTRYVAFRVRHELERRSGWSRGRYPTEVVREPFVTLAEWRRLPARFFFESREALDQPRRPTEALRTAIEHLRAGRFPFFSAEYYDLGTDYDWVTNPDSGHRYDASTHWMDVPDFSAAAGDIKFVWEKSRFSYLLTILRYDYHFGEDCAEWVFSEIDRWIDANPVNCGPNYRCSQEISLRMLNWLFALYYYRHSPALTEVRLQRLLQVCHRQLEHVRNNIDFSRIAVRNNHAITETMMLYLGGIFFPFFPEAARWAAESKRWLEEEIAYQIYDDGTFLQYSHNYHRVVVQLLTYTLRLSELNGQTLSATTHERAHRTLEFLYNCQDETTGHLQNYGANDGALFFPLSDAAYRDYRPQLNALHYYFYRRDLYAEPTVHEDRAWLFSDATAADAPPTATEPLVRHRTKYYATGGYFIHRAAGTLTFLRCGNHRDRPAHPDNLHLDLWIDGQNVLRDAGTYKYNGDPDLLEKFWGTPGHNTVSLGGHHQMEKGARFIWYHWSQLVGADWREEAGVITFRGTVRVFGHLGRDIQHTRELTIDAAQRRWTVRDFVRHDTGLPLYQYWRLHPAATGRLDITARDAEGRLLEADRTPHVHSSEYGRWEPTPARQFKTDGAVFTTEIRWLNAPASLSEAPARTEAPPKDPHE